MTPTPLHRFLSVAPFDIQRELRAAWEILTAEQREAIEQRRDEEALLVWVKLLPHDYTPAQQQHCVGMLRDAP